MMQMVKELLRGSFWRLDLSRVVLSKMELDFLSQFFTIEVNSIIDDLTFEERNYLILTKKPKYMNNYYFNLM